jgi:hypothetical protein
MTVVRTPVEYYRRRGLVATRGTLHRLSLKETFKDVALWRLGREGYVPAPDIGWCGRRQGRRQGRERPLLQEEHDASSNCNMRNIGWSVAMVGGIHTRKSHRAVPWRDECGRERIE